MSDISRISLQTLNNWDMRQFASQSPKVSNWNAELELFPIGALAISRLANGYSIERIGCISPADVIARSASIEASNKFLTQHYFDWLTEDIKVGDLLISRAGVIYVHEFMQDLVFSNSFILLRPRSQSDGLYLWAILNSTSGSNTLVEYFDTTESIDGSQVVITKEFLRNFLIPRIELSDNLINLIKSLIEQIQHNVNNSIDRPYSWVRVKKLNLGDDWFRTINSKVSVPKNNGKRLEELIETVVIGKKVQNADSDGPRTYMPFVTPKYVVHGRKTDLRQELFQESTSAFSKHGDLIIATSSKKAYFYINDIDSILGTGVVAIRPKPGITAEKLLSIFASASVQLDLNYLLSRGIVGHLSKSDLMNLEIPLDWETENQKVSNVLMLRTQLDALLWN
jgi:hypothetical protein